MSKGLGDKLVLAISSRALFDLRDSHQIYESQGVEAYRQYQIEHEDEILPPGDAFPLVEKLLALNTALNQQRVEVILVSRNSADTGLRAFNSIQHYGLGISRAAFVGGRSPDPYLAAFGCHLFLSTHAEDVRSALRAGFGAATILSGGARRAASNELRIAFDGDAVLFSDESERVYQQAGLEAFQSHERESARELLGGGPFKPFLAELKARHEARTGENPDFVFTRERLALAQELMAETSVSLNEDKRRAQHADQPVGRGGMHKVQRHHRRRGIYDLSIFFFIIIIFFV